MKNFIVRFLTGVAFASAVFFSLVFDLKPFIILFLLIALAGMLEFYRLIRLLGIHPNVSLGLIAGGLLFLTNGLSAAGYIDRIFLLLNIFPLMLPLIAELYRKLANPLQNVAFTYLGIFYIAGPLSLLVYFPNIHFESDVYEPGILLGFFGLIWLNDSVAYLVGSKFGKNLFFERVSPRKTWEGAIAGGLVTIVVSFFLHFLVPYLYYSEWIMMAILVVVFCTFGDLFESLLKRSIKVKDSGNMLPGHGGLLDRFDGVFIAAPVVFVYLIFAR